MGVVIQKITKKAIQMPSHVCRDCCAADTERNTTLLLGNTELLRAAHDELVYLHFTK
jgi:hypothetical protein